MWEMMAESNPFSVLEVDTGWASFLQLSGTGDFAL